MKQYLPLILTVVASLSAAILTPDFVAHHAVIFSVANVAAQVLHAVLPSIFK